jgi:integrase
VEDVDYDNNRVTIRQALQYIPGRGLVVDRPKSSAGARVVSLPETVMLQILDFQIERKRLQDHYGDAWEKTEFLFFRPRKHGDKPAGGPLHPKSVYRAFNRICESAGIPQYGIHALRHTHASIVAKMPGASWSDLQHRIGHAELSTTLNIYTHIVDDSGDKIAETLERDYLNSVSQNSEEPDCDTAKKV